MPRYYFRIEISAEGDNLQDAWENAVVNLMQEPGDPPPPLSELPEPPIRGTEHSYMEGEDF